MNYMKLNTPGQQAEAALKLKWDWTPSAIQFLTQYERDISEEITSEELAAELDAVLGYVPPVLLDVQRELGGRTVDYSNHWLDFGLHVHPDLLAEHGTISLAWISKGRVIEIDMDGRVHHEGDLHDSARTFVEWYLAFRTYRVTYFIGTPLFKEWEALHREFREAHQLMADFCHTEGVALYEPASDSRNRLWWTAGQQLSLQHLRNGRTAVKISTVDPDVLTRFMTYSGQHGF